MNWSTVKPSDLKSIHLRYEGDVNSYWRFSLDGVEHRFYGYESGPHFEGGPDSDGSLWDHNPTLYDFLCDLHYPLQHPEWDSDYEGIDFDLDLKTGIVTNIVIQHRSPDDDRDDESTHPGPFKSALKFK